MYCRSSFLEAEVCAQRRGGCISPSVRHVFVQCALCSLSVPHTYCTGTVRWHTLTALQCFTASSSSESLIFISCKSFVAVIVDILWLFFHLSFSSVLVMLIFFLVSRKSSAHMMKWFLVSACENHGSCSVRREGVFEVKPEGGLNGVNCNGTWMMRKVDTQLFWSVWLPCRHSLAAGLGCLTVVWMCAC